ncbi:MAG: hypothetical protein FJ271_31270 [Planctomycetes bacterium]|nr:hypothetical protein [Planctomycetota bacterium]
MSDKAAMIVKAAFSHWLPVKGRAVLQLQFEVPLEATAEILMKLGPPDPSKERWVAIALLEQSDTVASASAPPARRPAHAPAVGFERPGKRPFHTLPASQQAALLCRDAGFQEWLLGDETDGTPNLSNEEWAALVMRGRLGIKSRADLNIDPDAAARFRSLLAEFERETGRTAEMRG